MSEEQTTTEETQAADLDVTFIGTRAVGKKRQLVFRAAGENFLLDVDSKAFLAGKRVVTQGKKIAEMHERALKQGLIEV